MWGQARNSEAPQIARRCRCTTVDSIGVGMAAFGLLNPLLAAFIHVSAELVLILNSARLVPSVTLAGAFSGRPLVQAGPAVSQSETA